VVVNNDQRISTREADVRKVADAPEEGEQTFQTRKGRNVRAEVMKETRRAEGKKRVPIKGGQQRNKKTVKDWE